MKGVIYTRVSSDEQVKGTSLEFQETLCKKYCEQKGIEVVDVYREEGESAKDLSLNNRKKFLEALEFCRKNKKQIEAFIVLRVDRFARNTEDHFAVRKILMGYGTTLYSVTEPIGNKPAEKFIETVLAGAAEYDNAIRKQRCSDGLLARINQGIYPFSPPIGYKCQYTKKHGSKKTMPDPPDENIFPLIQRALKEYALGTYRKTDIVLLLRKWGFKTKSGQNPSPQLVDRILRKHLKFYAGIIVNPWTGEEREGLHQPMITKEEMYQIQLVLSGKAQNRPLKYKKYNPNFPLRRTVRCGSCNCFLTGGSPRGHGGRYSYYHCQNKNCRLYSKGIAKKIIEAEFMVYLTHIIPKPKWLEVFKEALLESWKDKSARTETEIRRHKTNLTLLEGKRKRVFEMREDGSYTKEEFHARKSEIESELANAQIALKSSNFDDFDLDEALSYAIDFIGSIPQKWANFTHVTQIRFQNLLFPEGVPYLRNQGFGTSKLAYILELIQDFSSQKSSTVHRTLISWNLIEKALNEWNEVITEYRRESGENRAT